jgi:drug/metabolite transporter (DMT)-like permease
VSAARLLIATLVLAAFAFARRGRGRGTRVDRRQSLLLAIAGVALAVHFATWIASLDYTSVAVSTLLVSCTPIFTAAYDALVHRRGLSRASLAAFGAGALGLIGVVGFSATQPSHAEHRVLGAALALSGAVAFAAYLILVRSVRSDLDTRAIVTRTYAWAAAALVVAALVARQPPPALNDATAWGGIVAMALIAQLIGHTAINASLRWFSPSTVSFSTLLEPVSAAVLAYLVFHEGLSVAAILGGCVVLAAIGVVLREDQAELQSSP